MPLTSAQRKNLRDRFIQGVQGLFTGDPGVTLSGQPVEDFLAGPAPATAFSRWQHDAGRRVCRRWAAGRSPSILPGHDLYYRQLCEPYIENEFGPLGDGTAAPPFTGGQCPKLYQVQGEWRSDSFLVCSTGVTGGASDYTFFSTEFNVLGPISGFTLTRVTPACGGFDGHIIEAETPNGPQIVNQRMGTGAVQREVSFRILAINPIDGIDDCGDPPDDWTPGTGPTIPPESGPITDPPGWPIPDFDIDITVDPDGNINIDFGDGEPPEVIDPSPPAGDGGPPALPPGDQGDAGSGAEAGDNDAEGEAPPGQVLVGLRLQLIEEGPRAKVFAGGVYRGAAYVYMGGDVSLDQDFAGSLLIDDQFVYAERENLTRWRVMANAGFRWNVTPYYRDAE